MVSKRAKQSFGEIDLIKQKRNNGGNFKEIIAKLSRGLMLPIAMLPIAGLALGIGTTIYSQSHSDIGQMIGNIIMMPGSIIFSILPLLFCVAIAITFTGDAGTAGLSGLVGYAVFAVFQTALIIYPHGSDPNYHFLWYNFDELKFDSIFTEVIGIQTLSSSIFGGLVVGGIVAYLYNRFKNIQLPKMIGFFSGVRFIPIVTFGTMCVVGMLFAMVWPIFGIGLFDFGQALSKGGKYGGVTTLAFGILNRALLPFGLHHVMDIMMQFTTVGGSFDTSKHFYATWGDPALGQVTLANGTKLFDTGFTWAQLANAPNNEIITGDINMQIYLTRIVGSHDINGIRHTITMQDLINSYAGVNRLPGGDKSVIAPGQYTNFAYIFTIFGLLGGSLGMIFAAPKGENRKQAMMVVIPAAFVSTLTGVTEPIEFTFLFLAPWLFWGFHAVMSGLGGMITTIFIYWVPSIAPHVGFSFSSGLLDFTIYGILPDARGGGTHCWILVLMSLVYLPIYCIVFYWAIKKWDLKTPGRGGNIKLFSKADWAKKQNSKSVAPTQNLTIRNKAMAIITAYGGPSNIKNIDACITKLRVQIVDKTKVKPDVLKALGAMGVMYPSPNSAYAVFGTDADVIKNIMKDIIAKNEYQTEESK